MPWLYWPPVDSIGRYEVVRPLGRGGMGQVFLARDPKLERDVAIKVLNRDDGGDARALFEREAKALAALNHPNIVTVFEIADVGSSQFIAMEYLPGRSLRELLQHDRPSRDELIAICGQVATALAAAHEAGILHRDIKPENVVVGKGLTVKVVDFGIARRLDAPPSLDPSEARRSKPQTTRARAAEIIDVFTRTMPVASALPSLATAVTESPVTSMTRTVFGTPAYMAPEVLMGESSSTASDVYSLGVMVHECLTGRRPYEAPQLHEVIARVIDGEEIPPIDDPLAPLVARMLDRDHAKRPSLDEVALALSPPPPAIEARPAWRWWWVALAAIVLGGVITTLAILRARGSAAAVPAKRVAVLPVGPVEILSYGSTPHAAAFTQTLTMVVRSANIPVVAPEGAELLATIALREDSGHVTTTVRVFDVSSGTLTITMFDGDPDQVATLVQRGAETIASASRPGTKLERDPKLAVDLVTEGNEQLKEHAAAPARTFFEQAVVADPSSAPAWDGYSASLAMAAAKRSTQLAAAARAYELAPDGRRRQILHGTLLVYRGETAAALKILAPLEGEKLSAKDERDLLFQIGECHWHEGRHDLGVAYFKRTVRLDATFSEAASHIGEYALARRDEATATEFLRMQRLDIDHVDFAMGRYQQLIERGKEPYASWGRIMLGQPAPPPEPLPQYVEVYERLAQAAAAGDRAAIEREIPVLLAELEPFTVFKGGLVVHITEAMLCAELPDPTRKLLEVLRTRHHGYHYKRLSLLAAPITGVMPTFKREELTERVATLQAAVEAELAGDRTTAIARLTELVNNPTFEWDLVERMALRRNLLAVGRTRDAAKLCDDTLQPPVMRMAIRTVIRVCRR